MSNKNSLLATKIAATFLLLVGILLTVTQVYQWCETFTLSPVLYILGMALCIVGVYIWKRVSSRAVVPRVIMGIMSTISGPFVIFLFAMTTMGVSEQGFHINYAYPFFGPLIFTGLFVWLWPRRSNAKNNKTYVRNSSLVTILCVVAGIFVALYALSEYFFY